MIFFSVFCLRVLQFFVRADLNSVVFFLQALCELFQNIRNVVRPKAMKKMLVFNREKSATARTDGKTLTPTSLFVFSRSANSVFAYHARPEAKVLE